jgi:hypothetical protein
MSRERLPKKRVNRRKRAPDPEASNALSVCDGAVHVGTVAEGVEHDGRNFAAFDGDGRLIGRVATCAQARAAIPRRAL